MANYMTPPIWNRYDTHPNTFWHSFSWIDNSNVGPVVKLYEDSSSLEPTNISQESQKQTCVFNKDKDISRKFPIEKALDFMLPVTTPLFDRQVSYRPNSYLWLQSGNCLDSINIQGKSYVVSIRNQYEIVLSEIKSRTSEGESKAHHDKLFSTLDPYSVIRNDNFLGRKPLQVIAKEINGRPYIVLRMMKGLKYIILDENLKGKDQTYTQVYENKEIATSVAMSDALAGCLAMANSNGNVSLYEYPDQKPLWTCHFVQDLDSKETVYQCAFGRHAFPSLIVNNESTVWLCDTRCNKKEVDSNSDNVGLTLKDLAFHIPASDIICKVSRSRWSHLYIVTSSCVLLLDERYCKVPVRKWHHMLFHQPSFAHVSQMNNHEILMLGNRIDIKVAAVTNEWSGISKNSSSVSGMPKHFDIIRDTVQFSQDQGTGFHHSIDRLGSKLTGFTTCTHPDDDNLLCFFLMNDMGDIFLQTFQESHAKAEVENYEKESSNQTGKKMLFEWERDVINVTMRQSKLRKDTYTMLKHYNELEKSLKCKANEPKSDKRVWNVEHYVINKCLNTHAKEVFVMEDTISLEKRSSKGLRKFIRDDLFKGLEFALDNKCTDDLSVKLLSAWQESSTDDFKYKTASFNTYRVSNLPKKLKIDSANNLDETQDFDMDDSFYLESNTNDSTMSQSLLLDLNETVSDAAFLTPKPIKKGKKKRKKTMDGF